MTTTLGSLVADLYDSFLAETGDAELASLATAALVNDLLCEPARRDGAARPPLRVTPRELYDAVTAGPM